MPNNMIVNTLLKAVMPTVQKFVESGKIDTLFRELKSRYECFLDSMVDSIEILVTTESDGVEYVNVVELTPELQITKVIHQQRLSELITALFNQAEL